MSDTNKSTGHEGGSAPSTPESLLFWKKTSGYSYREMIRSREAKGNPAYRQQEQVLTQLVQAEQQRQERALDVLEFGCGFGRHAAYLSGLPGVRYHGYDISEAMLAPLRASPPKSLVPLEERLFVGEDPLRATGGRQFDVVFTVSVLIHNPIEQLPKILESMGRMLRPGGLLVLIENQLVPFSLWDNTWHEGCWLHAFQDLVPDGWDLHHGSGLVTTHDVYVLKRNGTEQGGRRFFHLMGPDRARDEVQPISREALCLQALPRAQQWATQAGAALQHATRSGDVRVAELTERLSTETERFQRRQRLFSLADDLAGLRGRRHVSGAEATALEPAHAHPQTPPAVLFDDALDTRWANSFPQFGRLMHVFHQEWHGIRAAAGYLPGHKLAITSERPLSVADLRNVIETISGSLCTQVIVHGYSPNAHELLVATRKALGSSVRLLCVWHGSTAQFHHSFELECFAQLLELCRRGVVDRVGSVKPGMHRFATELFPKTLLNLPPKVAASAQQVPGTRASRTALIPTPNDWRKNFYTNLFAFTASPRLDDVYVTADFKLPPALKPTKRIHRVRRPSRTEFFDLVRKSDVVLNASLSECQPMTGLESLSLGVPCVSGPLSLGALDAHPYQRLAQVAGVDTVEVVEAAIEQLLALRERAPVELSQMMADYAKCLSSDAVQILEDFVQP
ncbi:methyltransferase [Myxococcaceae bacterium JPH2]|nr:methyltransferase [Myxococcaceae bacterium JPH2]